MNPTLKTILVAVLALGVLAGGYQLLGKQSDQQSDLPAASQTTTNPAEPTPGESSTLLSPNLALAEPYQQLTLLRTGTPAPAFSTTSASGAPVSLDQYVDQKKRLVMVFYQGSFCSVCGAQLEGIQAALGTIRGLGADVLAVSADGPADARKTSGQHGLDFAVVPDRDHKLISAFGVANHAKGGIAYPAVYILEPSGTVGLAYADPHGQRLQASQIIEWLKAHPVR